MFFLVVVVVVALREREEQNKYNRNIKYKKREEIKTSLVVAKRKQKIYY